MGLNRSQSNRAELCSPLPWQSVFSLLLKWALTIRIAFKYKSNALYFVADLNTYVSGMHIDVFIFLDIFKCRNYFLQVLLTNPRPRCRQGRQAGIPMSARCPRGNLWSGSDKHFWCFKITLSFVFAFCKDDWKSLIAIDSSSSDHNLILMSGVLIRSRIHVVQCLNRP